MQATTSNEKRFLGPFDGPEEDLDIDLNALFQIFWRNKSVIIFITVIGFLTALVVSFSITPRYRSMSLVTLDSESNVTLPSIFEILSLRGNKFNSSRILSEVEIMRSRKMAGLVVQRLNLLQDPSFLPQKVNINAMKQNNMNAQTKQNDSMLFSMPFSRFKSFAVNGENPRSQELSPAEILREHAITKFLEGLSVKILPGSPVIRVEYIAHSPNRAALYVNTLVDIYTEQRIQSRAQAAQKIKSWLDRQIGALDQDLKKAERRAIQVREQNGILEGRWGSVNEEKISSLSNQIIAVRTEASELQAAVAQIAEIGNDYRALQNVPKINNAPGIQRLKLEKVKLKQDLSDLRTRYGNKHPSIVQKESELEAIEDTLLTETDVVAAGIKADYEQKMLLISQLENEFKDISSNNLEKLESLMTISEIERHIESKKNLYHKTMEALQKVSLDELHGEDINIISYAVPAYRPISPNKRLIIILGTFLAFSISIIIAIIREKTDMAIRSAGHVEKLTGLPCYGLIPSVKVGRDEDLSSYIVRNPTSMVAESVRTLRMAVNLQNTVNNRKPKVISVTSSLSGEGKTTLSTWIAESAAKSGQRVILIDCDLRRPNVHRFLGHKNEISIVEYLTDKADIEEVIKTDTQSGMDVIYARSVPGSAMDLVSSDKIKDLIRDLENEYDLIVLDTPACLAVSDARTLATLSDLTLYAVSWGETSRPALSLGIKQFTNLDVKLATVLTNVDVLRQARYGYASTVEYYEDDAAKA